MGLLIPFCDEDPVVLHDEVLNILIAGRDTVSTTFSLTCMEMCLFIVFFSLADRGYSDFCCLFPGHVSSLPETFTRGDLVKGWS